MNCKEWISLGISHHNAPIELRERYALTPSMLLSLRHLLPDLLGPDEGLIILSTCNRVEWFASLQRKSRIWSVIRSCYRQAEIPPPGLLWKREGWDVLRHLARIVAGLDSMLVGESEIAGQVRAAYQQSRQWGIARGSVNRLAQLATRIGRRARCESNLDRGRLSLMSLAAQICAEASARQLGGVAAVLGSGEAGRRVIIELFRNHFSKIHWLSYHANTAIFSPSLAEKILTHSPDEICRYLCQIDCLVTCSADTILRWSVEFQKQLEKRPAPLVIVDLGVPRNTPRELHCHPKALLYNVDGLSGRAALHWQKRHQAAVFAEEIIAVEIGELERKSAAASPPRWEFSL